MSRSTPPERGDGLSDPPRGLVRQAMDGDPDAFGDLYLVCLQRLYRYTFFRVGDRSLAEDLTESVFLRAWEARRGFHIGTSPFIGWLYRIAHNVVVDHYRTSRPGAELEDRLPSQENVAERMEELEQRRQLATALRSLDPTSQQVISLRFAAELDHAQVARLMGRSESAVRVIQYRALRKLRALLQGE
ncbi:MAG: sigma-70 family RNA polymerase sigma factor [Chloroflexi bacterium]|nr:sigma-70 family RNA polymerase sigma factor [Chloroflexota bacterium]